MIRCPYNDCGWCYCPKGKWHNSKGGQCLKPRECPQVKKLDNQRHNG